MGVLYINIYIDVMKLPLFFLALSILLFLSCSDPLKPVDKISLEDLAATGSISGVSQKGPFRNGSSVVLSELDSNLVQSGRTFQAQIEGDNGSFEIRRVKLVSPYVLISVDGFYLNEVTGQNSGTKIALYAISDVTSKSSVNVNLMSHLEFHRVQSLADKGKDIAAAKKQAQGEILAVFGINGINFKDSEDMSIFGMSESDAALLAISVLLQGNLTEADFSVLLADFSQRIKASGVWDNEAKKAEIADWASEADLGAIRSNIIGWGLSSAVPAFEKYVRNYWAMIYGLGVCNSANDNAVKENANLLSANKDKSYVCKNGFWETQPTSLCGGAEYNPETQFCYNDHTVDKCGGKEYVPVTDECRYGVIYKFCAGIGYNSQTHFCQSGTTVVPLCGGEGGKEFESFQFCRSSEVFPKCSGLEYDTDRFCAHEIVPETAVYKCGRVSDGDTYNTITEQCCPSGSKKYIIASQFCHTDKVYDKCGGADYDPDARFCSGTTLYDKCGGTEAYAPATQFCHTDNKVYSKCGGATYEPATQFCHTDSKIYDKCGNADYNPGTHLCDIRDSKLYRYTKIGTQTWMAENLNYDVPDNTTDVCYGNNSSNCVTYGRLYNFATVMGLGSTCDFGSSCASQVQSKHRGICPAGWHIPSDAEWDVLRSFADPAANGNTNVAGTKLKAASNWNTNSGTDNYGFSALPGGRFVYGNFELVGYLGCWWGATEASNNLAYRRSMAHDANNVNRDSPSKTELNSVRCVQN